MVKAKVPVSLRAVIQRVNRKLAREGERLQTLRGDRHLRDFGRHYIVNDNNFVSTTDVDPEALARELGVLKDWETLEEIA